MRGLSVTIAILAATLFIAPQLWAKNLYLKNGEQIEYQSYRQKEGRIFVLINRDTEVDFAADEVDLAKTVKAAHKEKKKVRHYKRAMRRHHRGAVKAVPAAKPAPGAQPAAKPAPAPAAAPAPAKAKPVTAHPAAPAPS